MSINNSFPVQITNDPLNTESLGPSEKIYKYVGTTGVPSPAIIGMFDAISGGSISVQVTNLSGSAVGILIEQSSDGKNWSTCYPEATGTGFLTKRGIQITSNNTSVIYNYNIAGQFIRISRSGSSTCIGVTLAVKKEPFITSNGSIDYILLTPFNATLTGISNTTIMAANPALRFQAAMKYLLIKNNGTAAGDFEIRSGTSTVLLSFSIGVNESLPLTFPTLINAALGQDLTIYNLTASATLKVYAQTILI